jgi:ATP-binding cassette subfamily B (MDR/TAP) protein 1
MQKYINQTNQCYSSAHLTINLSSPDPGLNAINLGRIAAVEIYGTIERTPPIDGCDNIKGAKLGKDFQENIEFRNVVFAYPSRPNDVIFSNFNLQIEAGSSVALVGPSGSGKSSLSR